MILKTLLWKEYRQSRQILLACAILSPLPYLFVFINWMVGQLKYGEPLAGGWSHSLAIASTSSLFIATILAPFVAAQVMATERSDRSAEFAGYLPISRRSDVWAKTVFSVGLVTFMLVTNGLVGFLCDFVEINRTDSYPTEVGLMFRMATCGSVLMFGASWLASTLFGRPSAGAVSGIGAVFVLLFLLMLWEEYGVGGPHGARTMERISATMFVAVGIACFVAGTLCSLRRIEP